MTVEYSTLQGFQETLSNMSDRYDVLFVANGNYSIMFYDKSGAIIGEIEHVAIDHGNSLRITMTLSLYNIKMQSVLSI